MRTSLALIALLAVCPLPAVGQEVQEVPVAQVLSRIGPNLPLRVTTPEGVLDGRLLRVASDTLYVSPFADVFQTISLAAIDTLWIREGVGRQGATTGAMAGGGGVALLWAWASGGGGPLARCDGCGLVPGFITLTIAAGAGVGALVGAAVAKARWRRVYP